MVVVLNRALQLNVAREMIAIKRKRFEHLSCIRAAIVNDNDLMRHIVAPKFQVEMLDCRCNAALLILGWDNDGEQLQRG
jgi:hypothetical protein